MAAFKRTSKDKLGIVMGDYTYYIQSRGVGKTHWCCKECVKEGRKSRLHVRAGSDPPKILKVVGEHNRAEFGMIDASKFMNRYSYLFNINNAQLVKASDIFVSKV